MTWDDVEDVLFDGTPEQISDLRCPDCGSTLEAEYFADTNSLHIECASCGVNIRAHGCEKVPNFAKR